MADTLTPLFPLRTVLFPGGPLPLRVFEPRYLGMISRCLQGGGEFGVVLITDGNETGDVVTARLGTLARIVDWYQGSDGILGVTAIGTQRFSLSSMARQDDGLYVGETVMLQPEPSCALPGEYRPLAKLLETIIEDLGRLYELVEKHYDDATWVGCRLAEILPMPPADKQRCLELEDAIARLRFLRPMLRPFRRQTSQ